jgi:hypothetical protein
MRISIVNLSAGRRTWEEFISDDTTLRRLRQAAYTKPMPNPEIDHKNKTRPQRARQNPHSRSTSVAPLTGNSIQRRRIGGQGGGAPAFPRSQTLETAESTMKYRRDVINREPMDVACALLAMVLLPQMLRMHSLSKDVKV